MVGEWVKARGNRKKVVIAYKVGFAYPGIVVGTSAQQIEEECIKPLTNSCLVQ